MKFFMLYFTALLLQSAMILAFSEEADLEDADDMNVAAAAAAEGREFGSYARSRRGWSMMRLGRGLQMLRLGKRTSPLASPSSSSSASSHHTSSSSLLQASSPERMRELLGSLLEEGREESRRQPPMPRYGRELDQEEALEMLYDFLTGERQQAAAPQAFPFSPVRRLKRSSAPTWGGHGFVFSDPSRERFPSSPSSSSF